MARPQELWKNRKRRKANQSKGSNKFYSVSKVLKKKKKITPQFEVMLNTLTLEEVLALKLELGAKASGTGVYGFSIFRSLHSIVRHAVLMFALSATRTKNEAALFLGMNRQDFFSEIKKYQVRNFFDEEEKDSEEVFFRDF
jgi:hypothetical protein